MGEFFEKTKAVINYILLSFTFVFAGLMRTGIEAIKVIAKQMLGRFLYPVLLVSNIYDLLIACYKTYQDVRDWFLIRKRLKEFRATSDKKVNATVEDLINSWKTTVTGETASDEIGAKCYKERAARAKELVGAWNIFRNTIVNLSTIFLKLLSVIACVFVSLVIFSAVSIAIKTIFGVVASSCFAVAFGVGFCICAVKFADAILKLKRLKDKETDLGYEQKKKGAILQLVSSSVNGSLCLLACAALMLAIFVLPVVSGPFAIPMSIFVGIVGIITTISLAATVVVTHFMSKRIKRSSVSQKAPSSDEVASKPRLSLQEKVIQFIKIKSDNGLFWKIKKEDGDGYEYERDALFRKKQKAAEGQTQGKVFPIKGSVEVELVEIPAQSHTEEPHITGTVSSPSENPAPIPMTTPADGSGGDEVLLPGQTRVSVIPVQDVTAKAAQSDAEENLCSAPKETIEPGKEWHDGIGPLIASGLKKAAARDPNESNSYSDSAAHAEEGAYSETTGEEESVLPPKPSNPEEADVPPSSPEEHHHGES